MKKQTENKQSEKQESSEKSQSSQLPSGATVITSSAEEKIKVFNVGNSPNVATVSDTQARNINVVSATFNQGNLPSNPSVPLNSSTPSPVASVSHTQVTGNLYVKSAVKNVYQMGPDWPLAEKKFDREIPPPLKALYDAYQIRCQNSELAQALAYYVLSEATHLLGSEKRFDLETEVKQFLTDEGASPLLLIQGDSGSGKSLYANLLEQQLWQAYDPKQIESLVPIFIELKSIESSVPQDFIQQVLERRYGYTVQQIQQLRDQLQFIFILDGYDEMSVTDHRLRAIYLENELSKWNAKVVVTCRTQFLNNLSSYQHLLATTQNSTMASSSFKEIFVAPFNINQIEAYLKIYTEKQKTEWDAKKYLEQLDSLSNVREFIQSPLLLKIVIEILPELEKLQVQKSNQRITRADIYELFIRKWFERENLRAAVKSSDPYGLFGEFSEQLAFQMFLQGVIEVNYQPSERNQKKTEGWEQFFSSKDPEIIRRRAGCPLRRIGEGLYSFYHKSFMEYFCAMHLYEMVRLGSADNDVQYRENILKNLVSHPINEKLLIQEPTIIEFLAEKIKYNEKAIERLLSIVTASKKNHSVSKAAANAITIAKVASHPRTPFSGKDFSYIHINGANLDGAILDHTNLSYADLTEVSLCNAFFGNADLRYSKMKNMEFGEFPAFNQVAFSPDDRLMATLTSNKITLWDWRTKERLFTLDDDLETLNFFQFSRDGHFLISEGYKRIGGIGIGYFGHISPEIHLWEISSKKLIQRFDKFTFTLDPVKDNRAIHPYDLSHDGKLLAGTGFEKKLRPCGAFLWDIMTRKELQQFEFGLGTAVYFNSNDSLLISVCNNEIIKNDFHLNQIHLWDVKSGFLINTYQEVTCHAIDDDRKMLAFASKTGTLQVIDLCLRKNLCTFNFSNEREVRSICFMPDGKTLAFSNNANVRLLDLKSNKLIFISNEFSDIVTKLIFSGDGKTLMIISEDGVFCLWNIFSNDLIARIQAAKTYTTTNTYISYDGKFVISAGSRIQFWDINAIRTAEKTLEVVTATRCYQFSQDGKYFAVGNSDGLISIRDVHSQELLLTLKSQKELVDISFSHNGKMLLSCSASENFVHDITIIFPKNLEEFSQEFNSWKDAHGSSSILFIWSPQTNEWQAYLIKNESKDLEKKIVDVNSPFGETLTKINPNIDKEALQGKFALGRDLRILLENNILFESHNCLTIHIWDLKTDKLLFIYKEANSRIYGCAFSYDDTAFIIMRSGIMHVRDVTSGKEINNLQLPKVSSKQVKFSEDGRFFIAGTQLWNMQLMSRMHTLQCEIEEDDVIRFSHDSKMIAIGGRQGISLWDTTSGKLKKIIKNFKYNVWQIAFNCDNTILAVTGPNSSPIDLVDVNSGKFLAAIKEHRSKDNYSVINSLCFNPKFLELLVHYSVPNQSLNLWEYTETSQGPQWLLVWSGNSQLFCRDCCIDGVEDLSDTNRSLLEQNGAIVSTKQKAQDFFTSDVPAFFKSSEKKLKEIPEKLKSAELSPRTPIKSLGEKTKNRMSAVFSPLKNKAEELPKKIEKKTGFSIFKPAKDEVKSMQSLEKDEAVDLPKDEEEETKKESDLKAI